MDSETPSPNLAECSAFAVFWCEVTGASHITITAITPDGPATTATFARGEGTAFANWIAREQEAGRNTYFQPNETPPDCTKKPGKTAMVAALCRHADIDPDDTHFPLADERNRLHLLAGRLLSDPAVQPTAIIDSGNGIQILCVVEREVLSTPEVVERVEQDNRAIEAALGAIGTHDVSRLLRMPGTLNYPNAKKRRMGRGTTCARLLHSLPIAYTTAEAATLGERLTRSLAGSNLVRPASVSSDSRGASDHGAEGGPSDGGRSGDDPNCIAARIRRAGVFSAALRRCWAGDWSGLKDQSGSGRAFALGAALKRAGFTFDDTRAALHLRPDTREWAETKGESNNGRELRRIWDRVEAHEFIAATESTPDLLANPDMSVLRLNRRPPPPLPLAVFGPQWRGWIEDAAKAASCPIDYVAAPLLASASALIGNARWGQVTPGWVEPPHLWCGVVGDSGSGKSPGADPLMREVLPTIEARMMGDYPERARDWKMAAEAFAAAEEQWKSDVRAVKKGQSVPPPSKGDIPPEPYPPSLRLNDVTIERVAAVLATAAPKGVLIPRDELAGWLLGMNAYNDAGRAFWIEAYGGRPYRIDRVKHPQPIEVPRLEHDLTEPIR